MEKCEKAESNSSAFFISTLKKTKSEKTIQSYMPYTKYYPEILSGRIEVKFLFC